MIRLRVCRNVSFPGCGSSFEVAEVASDSPECRTGHVNIIKGHAVYTLTNFKREPYIHSPKTVKLTLLHMPGQGWLFQLAACRDPPATETHHTEQKEVLQHLPPFVNRQS